MFIRRGIGKEDVAHIYDGILLSHKRNKIVPFSEIWMDLETSIQNEMSERENKILHINTYIWNLEK